MAKSRKNSSLQCNINYNRVLCSEEHFICGLWGNEHTWKQSRFSTQLHKNSSHSKYPCMCQWKTIIIIIIGTIPFFLMDIFLCFYVSYALFTKKSTYQFGPRMNCCWREHTLGHLTEIIIWKDVFTIICNKLPNNKRTTLGGLKKS